MTFKGNGSSVEFQSTPNEDSEHDWVCFDCNLVTKNKAEAIYGDGTCWLANTLDAMDHIRLHVECGDMVPNELIKRLQRHLLYTSLVHQSLMSPGRRHDGSLSANRESAFFAQWLHEQSDRSPMFLQLLKSWGIEDYTQREVAIMASLVEWLGTNVGFCFLESALRRCGYKVVQAEAAEAESLKAEVESRMGDLQEALSLLEEAGVFLASTISHAHKAVKIVDAALWGARVNALKSRIKDCG